MLGTTPNEVLGFEARPDVPEGVERLRGRIGSAVQAMDPATLAVAADIIDVLATRRAHDVPADRV